MNLKVLQLCLRLIALLRTLVSKIRKHDRGLHDQIKRAASSIPLNVAEGMRYRDGNRRQRLETAAGSADETLVILEVAVGWGYLDAAEIKEVAEVIDRLQAMNYRVRNG